MGGNEEGEETEREEREREEERERGSERKEERERVNLKPDEWVKETVQSTVDPQALGRRRRMVRKTEEPSTVGCWLTLARRSLPSYLIRNVPSS